MKADDKVEDILITARSYEQEATKLAWSSATRERTFGSAILDLISGIRILADRLSAGRNIDGKFGIRNGQIVNLVSGQVIPEDEPLFLLRARDHHAYDALMHYLHLCAEDCNELHQEGIKQVIRKFIAFRTEHPERVKQPGVTRDLKLEI